MTFLLSNWNVWIKVDNEMWLWMDEVWMQISKRGSMHTIILYNDTELYNYMNTETRTWCDDKKNYFGLFKFVPKHLLKLDPDFR